jgi:Mg-chelatase subunit ChlD
MDARAKYIETQSNPAVPRRGGLVLKGRARSERQPVHLYFLIDTSGSMHIENKLANVQRSINFILPFLTPQDQLSLGTFHTEAKSHLVRKPVSTDTKQAIEYTIQQLAAEGNTNLSAGLLMAAPIFEEAQTDGIERKQGLILLTDGHANMGAHDAPTLLRIVKSMLEKTPSLSITTVGYGEDHNAELLSKMSIEGGGSYNIVKNLEDVASVFGEILGGLLSVSAQMIEVYLPPDVECTTMYPIETLEGGVKKVRIGDLYSEAEQTLLFKSSPEQGPIRITAVAMPSLERLNLQVLPELLEEGEVPDETLQLAEYRQQVSRILKFARSGISQEIRREANDILLLLEASSFRENLLVKMMMDDLKFIATEQPSFMNPVSILTQHETYLGVARGLRSPTMTHARVRRARGAHHGTVTGGPDSQGAGDPDVDEEPNQEQTSVFSNMVQRSITENLRTMSQQPH